MVARPHGDAVQIQQAPHVLGGNTVEREGHDAHLPRHRTDQPETRNAGKEFHGICRQAFLVAAMAWMPSLLT